MRFLSALLARIKAWKANRRVHRTLTPTIFNFSVHMASIHREVTPHGERGTGGAEGRAMKQFAIGVALVLPWLWLVAIDRYLRRPR